MQTQEFPQSQSVYTVSQLNNEAKLILESNFASLWIEGELSNFAAPHSGHWYFSLKDANAQVRCAMFKSHQRKLNFLPKNGLHVLIKARVSLYEARGEFQLIAEEMEERGEGKLRRAFEALKKKLALAGLFAEEFKKPLPLFPMQIGVVTSATGAAIRDILTVLKRRYCCAKIIIYPTLVQGETAGPAIVKAIELANHRKECDVLIVARGGGSLEDLWPFNEEIVAYAIHHSHIPIVSGVGHEIDFTIADFVADKRAATPSAAAEIITPDAAELIQQLIKGKQQILRHSQRLLNALQQQLAWLKKHLWQQHPKRRLQERMQQLDFCELALTKLQLKLLNDKQSHLKNLILRWQQRTPLALILQLQTRVELGQQQFHNLIAIKLNEAKNKMAHAAAKLDTLSPLATLQRGYAIVTNEQAEILRNAQTVLPGTNIKVQLANGNLGCKVNEIIVS